MSKISLLISLAVLISGCVSRKACNRRFPSVVNDSVREIYKIETVYRDTIIFVAIAGDTVYREMAAKPGQLSKLSTKLASSEAWISNGVLKHKLMQNDTTLPVILKNGVKTTVTKEISERVSYHAEQQNKLSWWLRLQIYAGRFMLIVLMLVLIYYCIKMLHKCAV